MARPFRPAFAAALDGLLLLVDDLAPVAATVSPDGRVLDVVGWADLADRPSVTPHPHRRTVVHEGRALTQQLPDSAAVTLGVAVVCVRRADVRPWPFPPTFEALVVPAAGEPVPVPPPDVEHLLWPRDPVDEEQLDAYVATTEGGLADARRAGAVDTRVTVHHDAGDPVLVVDGIVLV